VGLVVLIDVAHVYGTLFQTYFDPVRRQQRRTLLWVVPLACYAAGVALHSLGNMVFWRALAYLAIFHFIRQQYGFLRLYGRRERPNSGSWLAVALIYYATIYPLLYWHLSPGRHFNWFMEGEFVQVDWPTGRLIASFVYGGLLAAYAGWELLCWRRTRNFNIPRNLLLGGTLVSWYAGIIWFNGDLAFTMLNVVSHGIPYLALVWNGGVSPSSTAAQVPRRGAWAGRYGLAIFLLVIGALAYVEEGLWDGLVWREHTRVFGWFHQLPHMESSTLLMWLVPLLALPQATHYVLDGFIWRRSKAT
jgi:cytochrome c-type biogenesis protein CcmH/NrfF